MFWPKLPGVSNPLDNPIGQIDTTELRNGKMEILESDDKYIDSDYDNAVILSTPCELSRHSNKFTMLSSNASFMWFGTTIQNNPSQPNI